MDDCADAIGKSLPLDISESEAWLRDVAVEDLNPGVEFGQHVRGPARARERRRNAAADMSDVTAPDDRHDSLLRETEQRVKQISAQEAGGAGQ
jgi:hypothetical protein